MNSSSPESAHCRSSNTSTTGASSDIRSKNSRQPLNRSARSAAVRCSRPSRCASRGSTSRRSRSSVTYSATASLSFAAGRRRGPPPRRSRRARGPSPPAPSRPRRRRRRGSGPGASARSARPRRCTCRTPTAAATCPSPASPTTVTSRARRCSAAVLERVDHLGAARVRGRRTGPRARRCGVHRRRPATTRSAVHAWTGCSRPLTWCSPASS